MKQLLLFMLLLIWGASVDAQNAVKSEPSGPKAPGGQKRFNFAEQEAIVKKFTNSFDSLTPMQKNIFFTNVKHIMDPEVSKIEPGIKDTDPPSDAIVLFDGKDLNEWEEVSWGPGGPGGKKPITWILKDGGMQPVSTSGTAQTKRVAMAQFNCSNMAIRLHSGISG